MDIEQLKLIIALVQETTADAKQVIIAWFVMYGIKILFGYVLAGVGIFAGFTVIKRIIRAVSDANGIHKCREIVRPDRTGTITEKDLRAIRKCVVAGKDAWTSKDEKG